MLRVEGFLAAFTVIDVDGAFSETDDLQISEGLSAEVVECATQILILAKDLLLAHMEEFLPGQVEG